MDWIHVRLDGPGGIAVEQQLKSVYISGMDFEPEERRQRILPDGMLEIYNRKSQHRPGGIWMRPGSTNILQTEALIHRKTGFMPFPMRFMQRKWHCSKGHRNSFGKPLEGI